MARRLMVLALVVAMATAVASTARADQAGDEAAIRAAVDGGIAALNAMFAGDPEPFPALYSHGDDVTYMGAEGTYRIGWEATYADWKEQAAKSLGGKVIAEKVHVIVSGDMATATHITKGTATTDDGRTVEQRVRETSVFRKENGAWKMIGHQADNYPVWVDVVDRK
ncbi:MAG: DUF4440 domain-containing protein [Pseudomonadota bacterium]